MDFNHFLNIFVTSQKIRIFFTSSVIPHGEHSNHYKRFVSANITDEVQDGCYIYDVDLPTSCWPFDIIAKNFCICHCSATLEVCEREPCCHLWYLQPWKAKLNLYISQPFPYDEGQSIKWSVSLVLETLFFHYKISIIYIVLFI